MPDTNPHDFPDDDYSSEYLEPKVELKEPSEHALANWREAFQDFEKPLDGKWSDKTVEGLADALKTGAQMYALTYDPIAILSFAGGMALDVVAATVGKASEWTSDNTKEDLDSEHHQNATNRLTEAIISRDHAQIRESLDYTSEVRQQAPPPRR